MHWPPPVRVVFSQSTAALALIAALALATCAIVATLPLEPVAIGLATIVVVTWAIDRIYVVALRQGPRAVRELELRGDLTVIVVSGDGSPVAGRVRNESYVG